MSRRLMPMFIFSVLILISGCATGRSDVQGQYWMSPDRTEVLLSFPEKGEAYYFNNNRSRLCYTYKILGKWQPTAESALLRSADGRAVVGVLLFSAQELDEYVGNDLVTRASNRITKIYEKSVGKPLANVKLEAIPRVGAMKWSATLTVERGRQRKEMQTSKIFAEIVAGWVAQITVSGTSDDDGLALHILEILGTTSEPECYWPLIRKYFPNIR